MLEKTKAQKLDENLLDRRTSLPEKPDPIILKGKYVRLEPLDLDRDAQPLFEVSNGSSFSFGGRLQSAYDPDLLVWRYMFQGPFENVTDFKAFLRPQIAAHNGLCLCVFDQFTNRQVGIANLMSNSPAHLKIELGGIWYSPIAQRTQANTEATYLMLKHVFELGYRRIEWKCDALNERSRQAALKMGFKFEGIQESHMIVKGYNRDTAWFRMLKEEWREMKEKLEGLLYKNNSTIQEMAARKSDIE